MDTIAAAAPMKTYPAGALLYSPLSTRPSSAFMSRACVHEYLLSDARISARITEILGQRLREMERRLSDTVFKTVPQRIAGTLTALAGQQRRYGITGRATVVALTHEQIAALVGTSRETATKILGEFAERGFIRLGRGRITLLDADGIRDQTGD